LAKYSIRAPWGWF